jgi:N-methylhydantoinase B
MGMLMLSSGKVLHCKGKQLVPAGQRLVIFTAGGGGYGDPRERTAEELGADVRDSLVSKEAAHAVYCGGTA